MTYIQSFSPLIRIMTGIIVVLHMHNALYFPWKVRALYYVNTLHVFLGFSFPCVLKLNLK